MFERLGGKGRADALGRETVLHAHGQSMEHTPRHAIRALGIGHPGFVACFIQSQRDKGIEMPVVFLDPRTLCIHKLTDGDLFAVQQRLLFDSRQVAEIGLVHGSVSIHLCHPIKFTALADAPHQTLQERGAGIDLFPG